MIIQCGQCETQYEFDEKRLANGPATVRCIRCDHVFEVNASSGVPLAEIDLSAFTHFRTGDGQPVAAPLSPPAGAPCIAAESEYTREVAPAPTIEASELQTEPIAPLSLTSQDEAASATTPVLPSGPATQQNDSAPEALEPADRPDATSPFDFAQPASLTAVEEQSTTIEFEQAAPMTLVDDEPATTPEIEAEEEAETAAVEKNEEPGSDDFVIEGFETNQLGSFTDQPDALTDSDLPQEEESPFALEGFETNEVTDMELTEEPVTEQDDSTPPEDFWSGSQDDFSFFEEQTTAETGDTTTATDDEPGAAFSFETLADTAVVTADEEQPAAITTAASAKEPAAATAAPRPAAPKPIQPKKKTSKLLILLLLLIFSVGGIYAYFFVTQGLTDVRQIMEAARKEILTRLPQDILNYLPQQKTAPPPNYLTQTQDNFYVNNDEAGLLFVIQGSVTNTFAHPQGEIAVRATLYSQNGKALTQKTVFCGNPIDSEKLQQAPLSDLTEQMNNRVGTGLSNVSVAPGAAIPFTIVFDNLPADFAEFSVEAVAPTH
ncbi:MAG: zinc-ribbon domain-containing protein [Desulfuromonadaceae bacterium]|nr:zinc-ribbon domain-containing protein [Desulfuromonadaceae bacterium]